MRAKSHNIKLMVFVAMVLVFEVLFVVLASWQFGRMHEKAALRDEVVGKQLLPCVNELAPGHAWRCINVRGTFLNEESKWLENQRLTTGNMPRVGHILLTPLQLENGRKVLVSRGWAAGQTFANVNPAAQKKQTFQAIIRTPKKLRGWLNAPLQGSKPGFVSRLDLSAFDNINQAVYLQQTKGTLSGLTAQPAVFINRIPHQQYMLTWLALALITPFLLFFWVRWVKRGS